MCVTFGVNFCMNLWKNQTWCQNKLHQIVACTTLKYPPKKKCIKIKYDFPHLFYSVFAFRSTLSDLCAIAETNKQALHLQKRFPKLQDLADFSAKKQSEAGYEIKCFPKKNQVSNQGAVKSKICWRWFFLNKPNKNAHQKNVCHKWWFLNEMKQLTTNPTTKWLPTHDHSKMMSNLRLPYHASDPSNIMSNIWLPSSTPATWCQITSHQLWTHTGVTDGRAKTLSKQYGSFYQCNGEGNYCAATSKIHTLARQRDDCERDGAMFLVLVMSRAEEDTV